MKSKALRDKLCSAIRDLSDCKWFFSNDPRKDFSRTRKLPFDQMIKAILCMRDGSLANEMMDFSADLRLPVCHALFHENEHTVSDVLVSMSAVTFGNASILMTLSGWESLFDWIRYCTPT